MPAGLVCLSFLKLKSKFIHWQLSWRWPAVSNVFSFDRRRKHISGCYLKHRFDGAVLLQSKVTSLSELRVTFTHRQCGWLHPGATPGNNILITLIWKIPATWRSGAVNLMWKQPLLLGEDTGGAGTCLGTKCYSKLWLSSYPERSNYTWQCLSLNPQSTILHSAFFLLNLMMAVITFLQSNVNNNFCNLNPLWFQKYFGHNFSLYPNCICCSMQ